MIDGAFHDYIEHALRKELARKSIHVSELAEAYVVDMLSQFVSADNLNTACDGLPTLALLYNDAALKSGRAKVVAFRKLGDVSLFFAGLFLDYVRKTTNGLGYYIDMGRLAYSSIAQMPTTVSPIYDELVSKFISLVMILNNISLRSSIAKKIELDDIMELYVRDSTSMSLHGLAHEYAFKTTSCKKA
jgi:hypothetical protein